VILHGPSLNQWSAISVASLLRCSLLCHGPFHPDFVHASIDANSYYDTPPLEQTLKRLVDFDRLTADWSDGGYRVRGSCSGKP